MGSSEYFKNGTCRHCEETGPDVYKDTHLCEECDTNSLWCGICCDHHPPGNLCDHLYFSEITSTYNGAGATEWEGEVPVHELHQTLEVVGLDIAYELLEALETDGVYPSVARTYGPWMIFFNELGGCINRKTEAKRTDDYFDGSHPPYIDTAHTEAAAWLDSLIPDVSKVYVKRNKKEEKNGNELAANAKKATADAVRGWIVADQLLSLRETLFSTPLISEEVRDRLFPISSPRDFFKKVSQEDLNTYILPVIEIAHKNHPSLMIYKTIVGDDEMIATLPDFFVEDVDDVIYEVM